MLEVTTNNLVTLNGRYVGRVHKADATPRARSVRFYAGKTGTYDQMHTIAAPLYIGGPSDWTINPDFEAAVSRIVG